MSPPDRRRARLKPVLREVIFEHELVDGRQVEHVHLEAGDSTPFDTT
jgi:hypothetical protein